jgi:hypothetical protein
MTAIEPFVFPGLRSRVIFGSGAIAQTAAEIEKLGRTRALILSTPNQKAEAEALAEWVGALSVGVFAGAAMHTPIEVTETALAIFQEFRADCVVALGGGSTTGLGKAIAVRTGADQVVIPTTYAGSEMTDILGETVHGEKTTRRDPAILPETVIYDVDLTMSLPASLTVTSGLNAMAHAAEALYAPDRNPVFLASQPTLATAMHARTRSTAPGSAARRWAGLQWRCITSFATRSAAASIYRTPRRTRSSCRTRSGSMRRRRPNCSRPSPPPLAEVQASRSSISPRGSALR